MPSSKPARRFQDILDNIQLVRDYMRGITYEEFITTSQRFDAVAYCFVRLSEAASKLGAQAEELEPQIDWKGVRSIGNHLRHMYDGLDAKKLWDTIQDEFPQLEAACRSALTKLPSSSS